MKAQKWEGFFFKLSEIDDFTIIHCISIKGQKCIWNDIALLFAKNLGLTSLEKLNSSIKDSWRIHKNFPNCHKKDLFNGYFCK